MFAETQSVIQNVDELQARAVDKPWKIQRKGADDSPTFKGVTETCKTWKTRIAAHIGSDNPEWAKCLRLAEECPCNILPHHLQTMGMNGYTWLDLARELYYFLGKHIDHPLYDRMQAFAGGCVGDGFQLWEMLFKA